MRARHFPAESKLVREWCAKFIAEKLQWRRVGVGPLLYGDKLYAVLRKWADLVYVDNDTVVLCEAKVEPDARAVGQLLLYKEMWTKTPEFTAYRNKEIRLMFLTSRKDENVEHLCRSQDIKYVVYCPDWLKQYLTQRAQHNQQ